MKNFYKIILTFCCTVVFFILSSNCWAFEFDNGFVILEPHEEIVCKEVNWDKTIKKIVEFIDKKDGFDIIDAQMWECAEEKLKFFPESYRKIPVIREYFFNECIRNAEYIDEYKHRITDNAFSITDNAFLSMCPYGSIECFQMVSIQHQMAFSEGKFIIGIRNPYDDFFSIPVSCIFLK
ncbi:MAG: hypothetical protein B6230_04320 [Desulfobacteraceae bacterium 4572_89]|nr:MAG: hypothetical protein B6230_04320 [Desulfobacteraceae bacterium 4572_89]